MAATVHDLVIEQGATYRLVFNWYQESLVTPGQPGTPYDITGCVVRMQIRTAQQGIIIFDATTINGKIILDPLVGGITVLMTAADTDLLNKGAAKYDLEIEFTTGPKLNDVYRLLKGNVSTDANITQKVTDPVVT